MKEQIDTLPVNEAFESGVHAPSASWKNSKDAVSRSMQKLRGGYPADAPFKQE